MKQAHRLALGAGVLFASAAGFLCRRFPSPYVDEAIISVHGWNLWSGLGNRYSLYDDLFARAVYPMRDIFPDITRLLYNAWVGIWLKAFGHSLEAARLSSIAAALLALLFLYRWLRRIGASELQAAAATALLAANPLLLTAACIVRPEAALTAWLAASLWVEAALPACRGWRSFFAGAFAGLGVAIHWNMAALFPGFLVYGFVRGDGEQPARKAFLLCLGFACTAVLCFCTVRPDRLVLLFHSVSYLLSSPAPVLESPLRPWLWLAKAWRELWMGGCFFLPLGPVLEHWKLTVGLADASLMAMALAALVGRPRDTRWNACALGALVSFVFMAALLKRKEMLYFVILLPYISALAGSLFQPQDRVGLPRLRQAGVLASGAAVLGFFAVAWSAGRGTRRLPEVMAELKGQPGVATAMKIAGPPILWFGWPPEKVRDLGAVVYSSWYNGGKRELRQGLEAWRPDILVFDVDAERRLFQGATAKAALAAFGIAAQPLGQPVRGPAPEQRWKFLRLDWNTSYSGTDAK